MIDQVPQGNYFVVRNGMLWGWFDNGGGPGPLGCPTDDEADFQPTINQYGDANASGGIAPGVQTFDHGDLYWVNGMNHAQAIDPDQAGAIAWAWQNWSNKNYDQYCLAFVEAAYESVGVKMSPVGSANGVSYYWNNNYDPAYTHHTDRNPPVGALVFWGPNPWTSYGHVGIYLGADEVVSTDSWPEADEPGLPGHTFSFSGRNTTDDGVYDYLGWTLPGSSAPTSPPTSLVSLRITTTTSQTSNPGGGYQETPGGPVQTWTSYSDAGGSEGATIPAHQTVSVTCRAQGLTVTDGNNWWYQIASSPWNGNYYGSADAFYNDGATSGSLQGTPFFDPAVPVCGEPSTPPPTAPTTPPAATPPPPVTFTETVGGVTDTWTDYSDAGGAQGPSIPASTTVQVACAVPGFRVADGDTWWYRIASSPWSNTYYASADAFYNDGATSGSLQGTPFVDPTVPAC